MRQLYKLLFLFALIGNCAARTFLVETGETSAKNSSKSSKEGWDYQVGAPFCHGEKEINCHTNFRINHAPPLSSLS